MVPRAGWLFLQHNQRLAISSRVRMLLRGIWLMLPLSMVSIAKKSRACCLSWPNAVWHYNPTKTLMRKIGQNNFLSKTVAADDNDYFPILIFFLFLSYRVLIQNTFKQRSHFFFTWRFKERNIIGNYNLKLFNASNTSRLWLRSDIGKSWITMFIRPGIQLRNVWINFKFKTSRNNNA